MAVTKIISGGQTGADRTALEVARELGIATGGHAPRGWRTDEGADPSLEALFGLVEHTSADYPPRTRANVENSDGTVIFGNVHSPGCALTVRLCMVAKKPYLDNPSPARLREWLERYAIRTLNVAGNRARTNPGIVAQVRQVLTEALR